MRANLTANRGLCATRGKYKQAFVDFKPSELGTVIPQGACPWCQRGDAMVQAKPPEWQVMTNQLLTIEKPSPQIAPMINSEVVPAGCPVCGMSQPQRYVYGLGTVTPRFPSQSLEKAFIDVIPDKVANIEPSNRERLYQVLKEPKNYYLAREMCWVFTVESVDTYLIEPRTDTELVALIDALQGPVRIPLVDIDVVIGVRGPLSEPTQCQGVQLPRVRMAHFYYFAVDDFLADILKSTKKPSGVSEAQQKTTARDLFMRLMQIGDNVGEMDEHRAVNYLALRYPEIYQLAFEQSRTGKTLKQVDVSYSPLSGTRHIVEVIFTYVDRQTSVPMSFFARVDVTGMYPFLVSPIQLYYGN